MTRGGRGGTEDAVRGELVPRGSGPRPPAGAPDGLPHRYGPRMRLLDDPFLLTVLARLSRPETPRAEVVRGVRVAYEVMVSSACRELPTVAAEAPTRMAEQHPEQAVYRGPVLDPSADVVVVDVLRAGLVPSQTTFERLLGVLPDDRVRLDHLQLARVAGESGHVERVDLSGSKIGGSVEGRYLVVPDPMGATGSTLCRVLDHYLEHHGRPRKVISMAMMATPEFLRRVLDRLEDLVVHVGRLDRGLSPPDVLETLPGTHWDRERGLDENDYIVPGAGGMGEVLNNAWV